MSNPQHRRQCFEIVIRGRLSQRFESALDDVQLVARNGQTTLRANLIDQSALYGLLTRLRDFGIEPISVNPAGEVADAG